MSDSNEPTILCIASFLKANDFIRECPVEKSAMRSPANSLMIPHRREERSHHNEWQNVIAGQIEKYPLLDDRLVTVL